MNLKALLQKLMNRLTHKEELSDDAVLSFLRVLETVREEGASCDEIFAKIDEYVEQEVDKKDAERLMPLIRNHLDLCNECEEEYEALLDVLEKTSKN
jgi:hypothetical protein